MRFERSLYIDLPPPRIPAQPPMVRQSGGWTGMRGGERLLCKSLFEIFAPFAPVMLALAILGGLGLAVGLSPVLG